MSSGKDSDGSKSPGDLVIDLEPSQDSEEKGAKEEREKEEQKDVGFTADSKSKTQGKNNVYM